MCDLDDIVARRHLLENVEAALRELVASYG